MKELVDYAKRFIGVPYKWGGSNPFVGFDCSGYVQFVLDSVGMDPRGDQTCQAMYQELMKQNGAWTSRIQAGAIVFYGKSEEHLTHISIAINGHQVIEAGGGDSTTTSVSEAARRDACVRVRPSNHRKDIVAVVMPNYPEWMKND